LGWFRNSRSKRVRDQLAKSQLPLERLFRRAKTLLAQLSRSAYVRNLSQRFRSFMAIDVRPKKIFPIRSEVDRSRPTSARR
jgi:hypothetical protein